MNRHPTTSNEIPVVTLAGLPALAGQLAARVRATGFAPAVIVYVERGARLLAVELCREFSCGAIAAVAQRKGGRVKALIAHLAGHLPRRVRDTLRRTDQRWLWRQGGAPRVINSDFSGSLAGQRVLLVDDAADSGRTIAGCLAWLAVHGAPRAAVRVAVLAATTPAGRAAVDCWIFERNSRMPWSADSTERADAEQAWHTQRPPRHAPRDL